ncbi:MAG: hypothetical protein K2X68_04845, partial [Novosphingobium sp.]|nr:hypothetical protein [Novosphingobium sp.]
DPIALGEVLPYFAKSMALRMPAVFLVGSVCSVGKSENDLDVLIRGPLDRDTMHAIKVRMGRALPPRMSGRVQFIEDSLGGPIGAHVPLYDLVLVPHASRDVVAMAGPAPERAAPPAAPDMPAVAVLRKGDHPSESGVVGLDLRIQKAGGGALRWTLAVQRPGVRATQSAAELAKTFNVRGSRWNKGLMVPERVFAVMRTADSLEAGEGAAVVARMRVAQGLQLAGSAEYFLSGDPRMCGALVLRKMAATVPDNDAWSAGFSKTLVPRVLHHDVVQLDVMPPLGCSAMPVELMEATPGHLQFWKANNEREAREVRNALVRADVFNDQTVQLDSCGRFALGTSKFTAVMRRVAKSTAHVHATNAGGLTGMAADTPGHRHPMGGGKFTAPARGVGAEHDHTDEQWQVFKRRLVQPEPDDLEVAVRVLKRDGAADTGGGAQEERFVFGVILVPDDVDAQSDTYTADDVRKACHSFMEFFGGRMKVMHRGRPIDGKVKVLENYVTKQAERHGGETFPAGTWMLGIRVIADDLWRMVKSGEFNGFSIGGTAIREKVR